MLTQEQKEYLRKQKEQKKEEKLPGFDLRAQIIDKTGELQVKQDYFIHVKGTQQFFERPIGSGNLFFSNGEEAGRVEMNKEGQKVFDHLAKHKEFQAPQDADGELFERYQAQSRALEAAQKELDAIKKEKLLAEKELSIKANQQGAKLEAKAEAQAAAEFKKTSAPTATPVVKQGE